MIAQVVDKAEILAANVAHKTFSGTNSFIQKGETIKGTPKLIHGLRKGKPFDYRLFELKNNKFIYLNKTNLKPDQMKSTDIKLGADSSQSPTVINTNPPGNLSLAAHPKLFGTLIGGLVGFAYSHTMKHEPKKKAYFTAGGAALGLAVGAYIQHRRAIVIAPSK